MFLDIPISVLAHGLCHTRLTDIDVKGLRLLANFGFPLSLRKLVLKVPLVVVLLVGRPRRRVLLLEDVVDELVKHTASTHTR